MKKIIVLVLCLIVLVALSACTIDLGDFKVDLDNKIDLSVGSGSISKAEESSTASADNVKKIIIENKAGNIKITPASGKDLEIRLIKQVKSGNEAAKKAILDNIGAGISTGASRITLEPKTKDNGEDPWKWAKEKYGIYNISIDLEVKVPAGIEEFEVRNEAGNIQLNDIQGYVYVKNNAGNLDLNEVKLKGNNYVKLVAGNINIRGSIENDGLLDIGSNAGNVSLFMPADQKFDLDARTTAGNIGGSFLSHTRTGTGSIKESVNGGGADIKIRLNAGNTDINKQ